MKLFVLSALVAAAYSLPLEGEGVPTKNVSALDLRIFNGREAEIGQFPWQAYLAIFSNSFYRKCGGSLIRSQWVLTAAYCLKHSESMPTLIFISLGTIDRTDASETVFRISSEYYIHEDYSDTMHHDIALVKFKKVVQYTENVRAIPLGGRLFPASHVKVSGFGDTAVGKSSKLYYADLITMKNFDCQKETGYLVPYSEVCAKPVKGSICSGDRGSALVMQENGEWRQFGVTSGALYGGCEFGTSVYTRISYYSNWILQKIRLHT